MFEEHRDIVTADGAVNSIIVYPDRDGPCLVASLYTDAAGKREQFHELARRIE